MNVGTPGQDFRVLASTQAGVAYVIVPEGCLDGDGADCPNQRGIEVFSSAQSPGFQANASSSWSAIGQYSVNMEQKLNISTDGFYGYDKISLGPAADSRSLSLDKQVVAGVADFGYYMGHIPLGIPDQSFSSLSTPIESFIHQLRKQSKIPSLSFAYTAGAKYRLKTVFGSLILGGYDSTRFKPNANPFSFSFSTDPSRLLTVGVESIMATNTLKGTFSLSSGAHFSLIDSTVPHLWLPRQICDNFEQAFGLTYDPQTDLYVINSTMYAQLKAKNPTITIKLVNSLENTSSNYTNIVLPYAAFDLQASYPWYSNATNYFPIRRAANDTQYVLGRTLLQEAYLIVDYERANFSISQAVFPDPLPAANIVTITPGSNSTSNQQTTTSSSSLGTAAIAGIAAGGAALLLIIGLAFFFFHRKRSSKKKYELANTQISESGSGHLVGGVGGGVAAQKYDPQNPQELYGTPLTELASPTHHHHGGSEHKPFLTASNVPQELPTPSETHPRWREVTRQEYYEMDGSAPPSQVNSRAPSEDGRPQTSTGGSTLGISPLTQQPRWNYN